MFGVVHVLPAFCTPGLAVPEVAGLLIDAAGEEDVAGVTEATGVDAAAGTTDATGDEAAGEADDPEDDAAVVEFPPTSVVPPGQLPVGSASLSEGLKRTTDFPALGNCRSVPSVVAQLSTPVLATKTSGRAS